MKYKPGFYTLTETFQNIPEHAAVRDAGNNALMAVTGPADDTLSLALVRLFAAAPDLLTALQETTAILKFHRDGFEDEADNLGCDAGNWDGGSASNCEHCQLRRAIEKIDEILSRASTAIAAATGKEIDSDK